MVGTGIFATPSSILALSGSVGLALFLWVAGMLIAAAGSKYDKETQALRATSRSIESYLTIHLSGLLS